MRKYVKYISAIFLISLLAGCASSGTKLENKLAELRLEIEKFEVSDLEEAKVNETIYVEDTDLQSKEEVFIQKAKDLLNDKNIYTTEYSFFQPISPKINLEDGFNMRVDNGKKLHFLFKDISNSSVDDVLKFVGNSKYEKKRNFELEIVDRKLVSKKSYSGANEIFVDYFNIVSILKAEDGIKLTQDTGYSHFVLDGKALMQNKLSLIPFSRLFTYKNSVEKEFMNKGYKVTNNKEEATVIVGLNINSLLLTKQEDFVKQNDYLKEGHASMGQGALYGSRLSGASSGGSAAIGLGIFALELFSGTSNKKDAESFFCTPSVTFDYADNKTKVKSEIKLNPLFNVSAKGLYDDFYKMENGNKEVVAKAAVRFVETGRDQTSAGKKSIGEIMAVKQPGMADNQIRYKKVVNKD